MDVLQGQTVTLPAGMTLTVSADAQSSGIVRRIASKQGFYEQAVSANAVRIIGPFNNSQIYSIEPVGGKLSYSLVQPNIPYANHRLNVESFNGALRISDEHNGKVLRCDDTDDIIVTVGVGLPLGFNCELIMYSTGTVTLATEAGLTNLTGATLLDTQYEKGVLRIMKDGELLVDGNFSIPAP